MKRMKEPKMDIESSVKNDMSVSPIDSIEKGEYSPLQMKIRKPIGQIRQIRPNLFQFYFSHGDKRYFIQRGLDGVPLRSWDDALQVQGYVSLMIQENSFDPKMFQKDTSHSFNSLIRTWLKLSDCSPEWLEKRKRIANNIFIPFFGDLDVRDIPSVNIKINEFNVHLKEKVGDKYRKNLLSELKTFFNSISDLLPRMPKFPKIKVQKPIINWITSEAQDQIFEFIPSHHKPIFTLMRYTGCRPNEAGGFLKKNIFWDRKEFALSTVIGRNKVIKFNTKNKREKMFPFIPELEDDLMRTKGNPVEFVYHMDGRPYTVRRLEKIWDKANKLSTEKYGTPRIRLYQGLKHSFVSQRLEEDYTYDQIAEVLGISPEMVRTRYGKYQTGKLVNIMRGKKKTNPFTPEFTDIQLKKSNDFKEEMVGARGFEPPTPDTPCQCATRLRYAPTRTCILME